MALPITRPADAMALGFFQPFKHITFSNPSLAESDVDTAMEVLSIEEDVKKAENYERPTRKYQVLLLFSGFLMSFHTTGTNLCYGIFQEFYTSSQSNIRDAQGQDALVSLVGSIATGLTWGGSIFVNPMILRVHNVKLITMTGVFLMSLGLFTASYSTKLWHLYITQSILYGIGASMYYFPVQSLAPVFFDRHRGFAMGCIAAGSGVGGVVLAPVLRYLLDKVGIGWTLRILGIWNLAIGLPAAYVLRQPPTFGSSSKNKHTTANANLLTSRKFIFQCLGAFLQASGNVVPSYYITTYSTTILLWSSSTSNLMLAINNGVNAISRILMGLFADTFGRQNTMVSSVLLSGLSVFALWYDARRARFISFVVIYGIYAGGYNALLPTTITEVYGIENYTKVNGIIYFIRGLGAVFGAPFAGLILGSHKRSMMDNSGNINRDALQKRYNVVSIYDGLLLIVAGLCVGYVRWLDACSKGGWGWKA